MKLPPLLSALLLAATLATPAGCISGGRQLDLSLTAQIRPGTTTVADLERLFGPPYSRKAQPEGGEKLVWQYTKVGVAVGIVEQKELFVTTDNAGKVVDYSQRQKGR